jgi:hypothetical protein
MSTASSYLSADFPKSDTPSSAPTKALGAPTNAPLDALSDTPLNVPLDSPSDTLSSVPSDIPSDTL